MARRGFPTRADSSRIATNRRAAALHCALAACALVAGTAPRAQDIEPRAYSNAPVGVNFLIAGYAYTRGGLAFDPSLPVTDENLQHVERGPRLCARARPVGQVRQVRR